jgi:hypothetical protein
VAKTLGAGADGLFLRERATESRIRTSKLSDYRILAFATHGLVSGDLKGLAEPAFVLTPPKKGTAEDDGLLTASEVATLKLNADWVILSACNTVAPDGTPGAEALSGLAKAFFYAGSRALLVSHWPVASKADVPERFILVLRPVGASPSASLALPVNSPGLRVRLFMIDTGLLSGSPPVRPYVKISPQPRKRKPANSLS